MTATIRPPLVPAPARHFGAAWVAMALTIALHVTDEAATDFLSVYNPAVRAIRARWSWLPLPTFTFGVWLAGLAIGVALLLALAPLAGRGNRRLLWLSLPLSGLMFFNGLGHVAGSLYLGRLMPGVYSAPLLLLVSATLFVVAWNNLRARGVSDSMEPSRS